MVDVNLRYWKREEKDGVIYFATATNAGHTKAEADTNASEVGFEEYRQNVPASAHNGADRTPQTPTAPDPQQAKQAAWEALQAWTNHYGDVVAVQDQIAMLALWQFQLSAWATNTMAANLNQGVQSNVN